jgi:hypothetical protein
MGGSDIPAHTDVRPAAARSRRALCATGATLCGVLCGLALLAPPAMAQRAAGVVQPVRLQPVQETVPLDPRFLASAVLPGAAQFMMGDDRWVPYVAAEAWAWVSHLHQRRSARSLERRYRDLAWDVPRRADRPAERRDTIFEYYEAMAHYQSSGAFDLEPNLPGVQPERQLGTYNGDVWALARALFFPGGAAAAPGSPAYQRALDYYLANAIPPGYGWAWGGSLLEQQVFADLIADSDAAFRSGTRYLGVILANHITSAVDALVTARLRQLAGEAVRLETGPVRAAHGVRWEYGLRILF